MSRREQMDAETARVVEQRLQWLLQENGPGAARGPGGRHQVDGRPAASRKRERPPEPGAEVHESPAETDGVAPPPRQRRPRPEAAEPPGGATSARNLPVANAMLSVVGSFRRPHLVVVATIVGLGILLAGWAVLRARPVAVAVTPPPAAASRAQASVEPSAAGASPSPVPEVVVHVLGAVEEPGLVSLPATSRVQDALEAAGGLTSKADPGELNLAQAVADGQQIVVGTKGKPSGEVRDGGGAAPGAGGGASGGSTTGGVQTVNLNTATPAQLEELPGVGPVMAGKIVAWRTENGRFSRVEELQEIDGVGPKTYAKLAPLCRV